MTDSPTPDTISDHPDHQSNWSGPYPSPGHYARRETFHDGRPRVTYLPIPAVGRAAQDAWMRQYCSDLPPGIEVVWSTAEVEGDDAGPEQQPRAGLPEPVGFPISIDRPADLDPDRIIDMAGPPGRSPRTRREWRAFAEAVRENLRIAARQVDTAWTAAHAANQRAARAEAAAAHADGRAEQWEHAAREATSITQNAVAAAEAAKLDAHRARQELAARSAAGREQSERQTATNQALREENRDLRAAVESHRQEAAAQAIRAIEATDALAHSEQMRNNLSAAVAELSEKRAGLQEEVDGLTRRVDDVVASRAAIAGAHDRMNAARQHMGVVGSRMVELLAESATDRAGRSRASYWARRWAAACEGRPLHGDHGKVLPKS